MKAFRYRVVVGSSLGPPFSSAFADLDVRDEPDGYTSLTGELDQAALFGVLHRIESLALTLVSIQRVGSNKRSGPTAHRSLARAEPVALPWYAGFD